MTKETKNKENNEKTSNEITINKRVKVTEQNGTQRISITNMMHTILHIHNKDTIYFKTLKYDETTNEVQLNLKLIKQK